MSRVKICPKCGAIAEWDSYFGGTRCTRCDFVEKPKPSHGDRIRAKSDEELAVWFHDIQPKVIRQIADKHGYADHISLIPTIEEWGEWLKEEATE